MKFVDGRLCKKNRSSINLFEVIFPTKTREWEIHEGDN